MNYRAALSPLVTVAFVAIAATGVLLFFHVKNGPIMVLHEWFGWIFVIAGVLHLLLNARPLIGHFRHKTAVASLVVGMILAVAMMVAGWGEKGHEGHRGPHEEVDRS